MEGHLGRWVGHFRSDTRICAMSASPCAVGEDRGGFLAGTRFLFREDGTLVVDARVVPGDLLQSAQFDMDAGQP